MVVDTPLLQPSGGFKYFLIFNPKIGEDEPNLTHIFQMGWNHQLVLVDSPHTPFHFDKKISK